MGSVADELEKRIERLEQLFEQISGKDEFVYNYIDEYMPQWARDAVQAAVDCGAIRGIGVDESGFPMLGLVKQDLKEITRAYRAGVYDKPAPHPANIEQSEQIEETNNS